MKSLLGIIVVVFSFNAIPALAKDQHIYPTIPGTTARDYSQPGLVIQDNGKAYRTIPGTDARDYTQPGYIQQGDQIYPTVPGTDSRDYTQPGYIVK